MNTTTVVVFYVYVITFFLYEKIYKLGSQMTKKKNRLKSLSSMPRPHSLLGGGRGATI